MKFAFRAICLLVVLLLLLSVTGLDYRFHRPAKTFPVVQNVSVSGADNHVPLKQLRRSFQSTITTTGAPGTPDHMIELEGHRISTASGPKLTLRDDPRKSGPYFVQFNGPIQQAWKKRIESLGFSTFRIQPRGLNALSFLARCLLTFRVPPRGLDLRCFAASPPISNPFTST